MLNPKEVYGLQKDVDELKNKKLPIASATVLGGVKVGTNLTIDGTGKLSATHPNLSGYATTTELDTKVDKVNGKDLVSTGDITQITTNKNDINNLTENKVDKVNGKELVSTVDINQITTNKNDIATLKAKTTPIASASVLGAVKIGSNLNITADGTLSATHPNLSGYATKTELNTKVDKVTGKDLVTTADIAQITTNKNSITSLQTSKADKVSGKELVSTGDITQITTNKTDISTLMNSKVDKVSGKDLVSTTDITQINKNKTDIANLQASAGLPTASSTVLGGVKVGTNLTIDSAGVLSATHPNLNGYATKTELDTKVDKVSGKDLVSTGDITQITTNKNDIATLKGKSTPIASTTVAGIVKVGTNLNIDSAGVLSATHPNLSDYATKAELTNKVDKVTGKELVSSTDIASIGQSKTKLAAIETTELPKIKSDISTAQTSLLHKVDKEKGMSLIETRLIPIIEQNDQGLLALSQLKVDKVNGKELIEARLIPKIEESEIRINRLNATAAPNNDSARTTTAKDVTGAINELNANKMASNKGALSNKFQDLFFKDYFISDDVSSGYTYLPNGFLIQWGSTIVSVPQAAGVGGQSQVWFNIRFQHKCMGIFTTCTENVSWGNHNTVHLINTAAYLEPVSKESMMVYATPIAPMLQDFNMRVKWFAIGF